MDLDFSANPVCTTKALSHISLAAPLGNIVRPNCAIVSSGAVDLLDLPFFSRAVEIDFGISFDLGCLGLEVVAASSCEDVSGVMEVAAAISKACAQSSSSGVCFASPITALPDLPQ